MADRAEVTKVNAYITIGRADCVSVPKVVAYLLLEPGDSSDDGLSNRQAHGHQQIIRRT